MTWMTQVMDALDMSWPDNSFDLVWACESGEHMPDKNKFVQEMTRVLKPGGWWPLKMQCWQMSVFSAGHVH
jgi:MPBQ/MSBQ methyltransferase